MDKPHITSIVGTRPNFIKLAALSPEIRNVADETIIHTGQHYEYNLARAFFDEMHIPKPDYSLGVGSAPHNKQIGEMLIGLDHILSGNHPDAVVVFGDTNSSLAGALASAKLRIPVIHIEAGCRSWDRSMPEETNRVIIDHISDMLFCSTMWCADNLERENVPGKIFSCGDVMVDLMDIKTEKAIDNYYLLTIHREENDNFDKLKEIFKGLDGIKEDIIFPCHPRIRKHIKELNLPKNIKVYDPIGYFEMRELEEGATKIITDSGGMQKEAYLLGVPCITLRKTTEWIETLKGDWNILTGGEAKFIKSALEGKPSATDYFPYTFGKPGVCGRIAKKIVENLHG
jgi:UDP-N-acetylglucosamine 2-epimerase